MTWTNDPIPFVLLKSIFRDMGYVFYKKSPTGKMFWKRDKNLPVRNIHAPPPTREIFVTLGPTFDCNGYDEQVYDRKYVLDLMKQLTEVADGTGYELFVKLRRGGTATTEDPTNPPDRPTESE